MKHIVVFTGAGISADSGLKTFRGADGLWEGYRIEDVATPEAWHRDPELVQEFYNIRRKDVLQAKPNPAHKALVELEEKYEVTVITQNIDDLHERAGSARVVHLHGLITRSQSSVNPRLTYPIKDDGIRQGDLCELGSQLRPHVVWFGEAVPLMGEAIQICQKASIFIVVGTSLQVYPAASLIDYVPLGAAKYFVDPEAVERSTGIDVICINERAALGIPELVAQLLDEAG